MLKEKYGSVLLKKNTILYHTTDQFCEKTQNCEDSHIVSNSQYETDKEFHCNPNKPLLFLTFHPSEWEGANYYVVKIILKKDIELLFMISGFRKHFIYSSLNELNNNRNIMSKLSNKKKLCIVKKLKDEKLDGWFSSIENKSQIEVALINDNELFTIISFEKLTRNWRNGNNLNNKLTCKNWGTKYEISTLYLPVIFDINERYKLMIEEYIKYGLESNFPYEYILQVILKNAIIKYHNFE
jgi:hypothetical protein